MNKKKYIQLFIRFLKDNKCYKSFIKNFNLVNEKEEKEYTVLEHISTYVGRYKYSEGLIKGAFVWDATSQRYTYWRYIDLLWQDRLWEYKHKKKR